MPFFYSSRLQGSLIGLLTWLQYAYAYDRMNYSRYLPAYWLEMINLPQTHPECYEDMLGRGNWTVQRQDHYPFSSISCDQAIEQTCNRDSKTRGGVTGFTLNQGATQRWILSQPHRSAITRECEKMAGILSEPRERKYLEKSRITRDVFSVKSIISTIKSMINPFEPREELVGLSTGAIACEEVKHDLLYAREKGENSLSSYINNRLISKKEDMFSPIKNLKLKTFSDQKKQKSTKTKSGKETILKNDVTFFGRLLVIAQSRDINLKEVLSYSLSPVSFPLSNSDGSLAKTNKAVLLSLLESEVNGCCVEQVPVDSALIIDGMAFIQGITRVPGTFAELADILLSQVISLCKFHKCSRVDFVTDRYPEISIKNAERARRSTSSSGTQILKIYGKDQKTPSQWKKFLSSGKNKESLIKFLFLTWIEVDLSSLTNDIDIFITHDGECDVLSYRNGITSHKNIEELRCDHEEADTRRLLHAHHASQTYNNVIICSPDTDVAVISINLQPNIPANIFFSTGTKNKRRIIDIKKISQHLGPILGAALIGIHVFTGCDSTSAFKGKGKRRAFQLCKDNEKAFSDLGSDFKIVKKETSDMLESFVCFLYGQKDNSVNDARYKIFCTNSSLENMPPTKDALCQHILRSNYQCAIHKRSLEQFIAYPSPHNHGWKISSDDISIVWMLKSPAPDSILESVSCGCKVGKCTTRCSCYKSKLSCSDMCKCLNCENKIKTPEELKVTDVEQGSELDSDSDSDYES